MTKKWTKNEIYRRKELISGQIGYSAELGESNYLCMLVVIKWLIYCTAADEFLLCFCSVAKKKKLQIKLIWHIVG